jgi:hypothetical protein
MDPLIIEEATAMAIAQRLFWGPGGSSSGVDDEFGRGEPGCRRAQRDAYVLGWLSHAERSPIDPLDPPPGWFMFGHHINVPVQLEFYGEDGTGLPIWERPLWEFQRG